MFYTPLKSKVFRYVWLVMFFSNIGTWAHAVTASILITHLTTSSIFISLIQTASVLPLFLFSVIAGVLADFYDRKFMIMSAQAIMASIAFIMALLCYLNLMTPYLLIIMTFLLNMGNAFNFPAWQAASSTLVPKEEIKQSAALNNLSFNLSRCIGPAIAGYFFSSLGAGFLFFLNGISFVSAILIFNKMLPAKKNPSIIKVKHIYRGLIEILSIHQKIPEIKFIFLKSSIYFFCAASIWALLPYIVIVHGAKDLGVLTGMAGLGAILNAYTIYYFRKTLSDSHLTTLALFLSSLVIIAVSYFSSFYSLAIIMLLFGYSWSIAISVFNGIFQAEFPLEIRARMIGLYWVFNAGSQAAGGYFSGVLVKYIGLSCGLMAIFLIGFVAFIMYTIHSYKRFKMDLVR